MSAREKILRYDRSLDCVHCGLCLPACPTYQQTGRESASPRGRIYLMRAFAEGRLEETRQSIREIDQCLVCRACETVCPSGVQFGEMMEITRDLVDETSARSPVARTLKRWFFRRVLPYPGRVRWLAHALGFYQRSGLQAFARWLGLPGVIGPRTALRDAMAPPVPTMGDRSPPPELNPALGTQRARVGYLVGCVAHELLPDANRAAIRVLQENGCEVHCPPARPCCGALAAHFGDLDAARALAQTALRSFPEGLDAIVVSSAGCASAMKEYSRLFEPDDPHHAAAKAFSSRVREFTEYLVGLPLRPPRGRVAARAVYDEPCHLLHAQGISAAPRELLASVPGLEVVDFEGQRDCCGAAGLYSLTCPESSTALLETKMRCIQAQAPEIIVTANPGCQLQLRAGARTSGLKAEVLHIAELLDRAYRAAPSD